jgi:hypothetical protein
MQACRPDRADSKPLQLQSMNMSALILVAVCLGAGQPGIICPTQLADGKVHLFGQPPTASERDCAARAALMTETARQKGFSNQLFACMREDGRRIWVPNGWPL